MCVDPVTATFVASTALSAASSLQQGAAAAAAGRMEARQYETRRVQARTETSAAIRERGRQAAEALASNKLAIAFSGLNGASFDALLKGSEAAVRADMRAIGETGAARDADLRLAGATAIADGRSARAAGRIAAGATIAGGIVGYETNRGFRRDGVTPRPSLFAPQTWGS